MSDGLSRLLPGDPQNLLSIEARKRIQRAIIDGDKFIWKAEVLIEKLGLNRDGRKAQILRNEANFQKAKSALIAFRKEFSDIDIPESKYREYMTDEIESASNSLQLSDLQRRLLEVEFFFPEEKHKAHTHLPRTPTPEPMAAMVKAEHSVGAQIDRFRKECHFSEEELAEQVDIDIRSVQRHIANERSPQPRHLRAYERVFSKLLNRQIVIIKMP